MPGASWSQYALSNGGSVPASCVTWYCIGVRTRRSESFAAGSSCAAGGVGGAKASARSPAAAASTTGAIRTDGGERGRIVGRLVERSGGAGVLAPDRFEAGVAAAAGAVGVVAVGVRAVEILVDLLGGVE